MVKNFKQAFAELRGKGFRPLPSNCVDGTEFKEWLRRNKHWWITRDGGMAIECEKCGLYLTIYDPNFMEIEISECLINDIIEE